MPAHPTPRSCFALLVFLAILLPTLTGCQIGIPARDGALVGPGRSTGSAAGDAGATGDVPPALAAGDFWRNVKVGRPFSPGVVFIGQDGNLWSLSTETGARKRLLSPLHGAETGWSTIAFWVSPNRNYAALSLEQREGRGLNIGRRYASELVLLRFGDRVLWHERSKGPLVAQWSPDGTKLAYWEEPLYWARDIPWVLRRLPAGQSLSHPMEVLDLATLRATQLIPSGRFLLYLEEGETALWVDSERLLAQPWDIARLPSRPTAPHAWKYLDVDGSATPVSDETDLAVFRYGEDGARLLRRHKALPRVTDPWRSSTYAQWSPDRSLLAFLQVSLEDRVPLDEPGLFLADARTGGVSRLASGPWDNITYGLEWSRDGRSVFWLERIAGWEKWRRGLRRELEIVSVRADGTGKKVWLRYRIDGMAASSLATM